MYYYLSYVLCIITYLQPSWSIKVSIAAQKFAASTYYGL